MVTLAVEIIRAALNDRKGVSALEYGVLAGLIIVGVTTAVGLFTNALSTAFGTLATQVTNAF